MKAVMHWNMFLREVMDAPFLEVFKAGLDGALSSLVKCKVSLFVAGGLELHDLLNPFQHKPFCAFMILFLQNQSLSWKLISFSHFSYLEIFCTCILTI